MNTTYGLSENDDVSDAINQSIELIKGLHEIMEILEKDQSQSTLKLKLCAKMFAICEKVGIYNENI